ncbi:hypothetical protein MTO96_040089, partial [Rhipicephalus appendiculatus]
VKRDEKYPKCHPCSMGFNNRKQYEHHCAGDFHCKNVEVLDNEVDESAGPLGEEYLEEVPAYYCTLCKLLMKIELKSHHCCTQGHYRRHRDIKRKEEAAKKAKPAKEKAEDEEDDTNEVAYTITDEVGGDDEARAASDAAGPAEGTSKPKKEKPAEETDQAVKEASEEQPKVELDMEESEAEGTSEPVKEEVGNSNEQDDHQEERQAEEQEALEREAASAAASVLDEQKKSDVPDTNGCKGPEEDVDEKKPVVAAPPTSATPAATSAAPAAPQSSSLKGYTSQSTSQECGSS